MLRTAGALDVLGNLLAVALARPRAALGRCRVRARSARHRRRGCPVALSMERAELALVPVGAVADARRRLGGKDDARTALQQALRLVGVEVHALHVEFVGVLVHREVGRALHAGQSHVKLHLRVVHRLGVLHALGLEVRKALVVVGLVFGDVPRLRRFQQSAQRPVQVPAQMSAAGLDGELLATLVEGCDLDADAAQFLDKARFHEMPGLEETQHPALELLASGPAEGQPQVAIAVMAENAAAQIRPGRLAGTLNVPVVDRRDRLVHRWLDRRHHPALRCQGGVAADGRAAAGGAAGACAGIGGGPPTCPADSTALTSFWSSYWPL